MSEDNGACNDVGLLEERRQFNERIAVLEASLRELRDASRIRALEDALKLAQELLARNGIQRPEIDAALAAAEDAR